MPSDVADAAFVCRRLQPSRKPCRDGSRSSTSRNRRATERTSASSCRTSAMVSSVRSSPQVFPPPRRTRSGGSPPVSTTSRCTPRPIAAAVVKKLHVCKSSRAARVNPAAVTERQELPGAPSKSDRPLRARRCLECRSAYRASIYSPFAIATRLRQRTNTQPLYKGRRTHDADRLPTLVRVLGGPWVGPSEPRPDESLAIPM